MEQSAKFWDRVAQRYANRPVADEVSYQKKLHITRDYLRPHMQVFEFGCGTGSTALFHAPYVQHVQAIDISSKMIEIAQARADAQEIENISFQCASMDEFCVPDESQDVVFAHSILHLLDNWQEAIERVHKMLKPGGLFISSTTCIGDSMKWFALVAPLGKALRLLPLVKVFTVRELEQGLMDAGFAIDYQWQPGNNKAVFIVAKKA